MSLQAMEWQQAKEIGRKGLYYMTPLVVNAFAAFHSLRGLGNHPLYVHQVDFVIVFLASNVLGTLISYLMERLNPEDSFMSDSLGLIRFGISVVFPISLVHMYRNTEFALLLAQIGVPLMVGQVASFGVFCTMRLVMFATQKCYAYFEQYTKENHEVSIA